MACNSIFYKFSLSRFLSIWILSYKCSYLFYNIPNNNFYRPLCVYMDDFGEAIKAIRERRRWEETANVICRKVSAENCHSRSPPLPPKAFLSSTSWGSSRIIEEERLWQSASLSSHRPKAREGTWGGSKLLKKLLLSFPLVLFFLSHQSSTPLTHFSDWVCLQFDILIANWFLIRPECVRCSGDAYRFRVRSGRERERPSGT